MCYPPHMCMHHAREPPALLTAACLDDVLCCPAVLAPQAGRVPLMWAVAGGHLAVVQALLAPGADAKAAVPVSLQAPGCC